MNKKVVIIGGGTGTSVVARAIKQFRNAVISVIVTIFDSGGSAGLVLDEHGALPASDAVQGVLALMPEDDPRHKENLETLRTMLSFRFEDEPPLAGRRLASYMMIPLERLYGFDEAIRRLCSLFQTVGQVIPVATAASTLVAHYANGQEVARESDIDDPKQDWQITNRITSLRVEPEVNLNRRAFKAIIEADYIIFSAGDLFTSVLPNVVVNGFTEALAKSNAKLIYIVNLMTRPGQTSGFTAHEHVRVLEEYLGKPIDIILNSFGQEEIPKTIRDRYALEGAFPVIDDLDEHAGAARVIRRKLVSNAILKQNPNDRVKRFLIRHDSDLLGDALEELLGLK